MLRFFRFAVAITLLCICVSGCVSPVLTGAGLIYDRHQVCIKMDDVSLGARAQRALFHDKTFKCRACDLGVAIFHRDLLLVGNVPSRALQQEAYRRMQSLSNHRRLFLQLGVNTPPDDPVDDTWITTKIRGQMLADSSIDPHQFKIVTYNRIVYIMGEAIDSQAKEVISLARECAGVRRVVKLLTYYHLSKSP